MIEQLKIIRDFQRTFPESFVGGSIGLYLHGIDLRRSLEYSDIDMITPDYLPDSYLKSYVNYGNFIRKSHDSHFDYRLIFPVQMMQYKMDVRVSPEPIYVCVRYDGLTYNVAKQSDIIFWKRKYANMGIQKHIDDMSSIDLHKKTSSQTLPEEYIIDISRSQDKKRDINFIMKMIYGLDEYCKIPNSVIRFCYVLITREFHEGNHLYDHDFEGSQNYTRVKFDKWI